MRLIILLCALIATTPVGATTPLIAASGLPAGHIIGPNDVVAAEPNAAPDPVQLATVLGMEVRRTIQRGQAVTANSLIAPALVERQEMVRLRYERGGLSISTLGRALGRAAQGETVRVMNADTRIIVSGTAVAPGEVTTHD